MERQCCRAPSARPIFHGKNGIQRWLAAISALNRLLASSLYPMAAVAVAAIHRLLWILTIGAVVPAVRVNRITGRRKKAQKVADGEFVCYCYR